MFEKYVDKRGELLKKVLELDFIPKELFLVKNVPAGTTRGRHAHITNTQMILLISGQVDVLLDLGVSRTTKKLLNPGDSVLIPKLTWAEQQFIVEGTQILVLCSELFDEREYIRDYQQFCEAIKIQYERNSK